jgi:hypothetical protein
MKRAESKRVAGSLPSFLEQPTRPDVATAPPGEAEPFDEVAATADADADAGDLHGGAPDDAVDGADANDVAAFEQELAETLDGPAPDDDGAPAAATPTAATRPLPDDGATPRAPGAAGVLPMALGVVALALPSLEPVLSRALPAMPLLALGTLLFVAGTMQRLAARLQHRADEAEQRRREQTDALQQLLRELTDDAHREKPPAEGEELQHVQMSLQRQDEKINNLTKAIKMYGKPLMEIAGQGTEFASGLASVKTIVEANGDSVRQGVARLETQLRASSSSKELAELGATLQKVAARVDAFAAKDGGGAAVQALQQQVARIEVAVAAVAQRLEDSEVRKSLLRLEETALKGRDSVQELLRGDALRQATGQLQDRVDAATKGLADGLAKLRDGNLGPLEQSVREIQREVAGVATAVAQIHAGLKAAPRAAVAAPAASTAPATAPAATSAAAAAPAAATPAPAAGTPAAAGTGEGAGYSTGTRTSGAKNVLGAIAKLKQMKG